jgi:hypothetical protein
MDLDAYRRSAETFVSELTGAYYRHYAGLDPDYAIEPIYDAHRELFTRTAVDGLRERVTAASVGDDAQRRLTILLDFATEGYMNAATKELEAEITRREASAAVTLGEESIELCEQCKAIDLGVLQDQTSAFSAASERAYPERLLASLHETLEGLGIVNPPGAIFDVDRARTSHPARSAPRSGCPTRCTS